jgi:hypothetical protein
MPTNLEQSDKEKVSRSENKVIAKDQSAGKFVQSESKHQLLMTDGKDTTKLNEGSSIDESAEEEMEPSEAFLKRLERAGPHYLADANLNLDRVV